MRDDIVDLGTEFKATLSARGLLATDTTGGRLREEVGLDDCWR